MVARPRTVLIPVILLTVLVLTPRSAPAQVEKGLIPKPDPMTEEMPPALGGYIVLDDHWWSAVLADEPYLKMEEALDQIQKNEPKKAAASIRKASAHLRIAAARSLPESKKPLMDSVEELDALARDVQKGKEVSQEELTRIFATGLQALAQHHAYKASESWLAGKSISSGYDLKAGATDLGHAADLANSKEKKNIDILVVEAEQTADRMILEEEKQPENVTRLISEMQERARSLGWELGGGTKS